jgi:BirA family biotin operon repressor/biotin-[acetyl-CoA-carboxylase] ligase
MVLYERMIQKQLHTLIQRLESLPSTNTEAARAALGGAPEGLCIVAREQTAGRGRQQRTWISPAGAGLYFSIVLRPQLNARAWPLITLMAALAVQDALKESCALATDIKWPNDILVNERKLCGILAEAIECSQGRACILGIGINLRDGAFAPHLREIATSVEASIGHAPDYEVVLQALVRCLARRYELLHKSSGAQELLKHWTARSSYATNKFVRVALADETFEGRTRGLEPDGALRVETVTGEIKIIHAGDVTALRAQAKEDLSRISCA